MKRLLLAASVAPVPVRAPVVPYAMPRQAPYNAPAPCVTPTPDGTGHATHPSVVDMGVAGWRGHRYWMGYTPYSNSDVSQENPCVLVSDNGYDWTVPDGLVNPIASQPPGGYNSDTELAWDQEANRLLLFWRTVQGNTTEIIKVSTSADGVTWSNPATAYTVTTSSGTRVLSPAVAKAADGTWHMFCINQGLGIRHLTATNPLTTWTLRGDSPIAGLTANEAWHLGVTIADGKFCGLVVDVADPFDIHPIWSTDATSWTAGPPIMTRRTAGAWDWKLYRPCLLVRDSTWLRVWYGADSNPSGDWRIGYTQLPRAAWL